MGADVETMVRRRPGPAGTWLTSVAMAGLAVVVVTVTAQTIDRFHWWAGFVLVPAALIAASGGPLLVRGGGRAFAGYLLACVGGLVFAVGAILMLGVMGSAWPLMIALPGLAITGTYLWHSGDPLPRAFHRTIALLGLNTAALGVTFLLLVNDVLDFGTTGWWGAFMMIGAVIILANGLELLRHRIAYRAQAVTLAIGPAVIAFLLGLRFLRDWPWLT